MATPVASSSPAPRVIVERTGVSVVTYAHTPTQCRSGRAVVGGCIRTSASEAHRRVRCAQPQAGRAGAQRRCTEHDADRTGDAAASRGACATTQGRTQRACGRGTSAAGRVLLGARHLHLAEQRVVDDRRADAVRAAEVLVQRVQEPDQELLRAETRCADRSASP